jgi:hypothetical protein
MEVTTVTPAPQPPARRPYRAPQLRTAEVSNEPSVLLACTGRFDCEPQVGYPCCAADDQCEGC